LSERDSINTEIRNVLDGHTEPWGVVVSVVEIKDIELPENMQRAMAKQAEAEREKRAKIIAAEGELAGIRKTCPNRRHYGCAPNCTSASQFADYGRNFC
jgi:regulator of protease activity HflC (stomatin/prohibitin superfamily)